MPNRKATKKTKGTRGRPKRSPQEVLHARIIHEIYHIIKDIRYAPTDKLPYLKLWWNGDLSRLSIGALRIHNLCNSLIKMEKERIESDRKAAVQDELQRLNKFFGV